MHDKMKIALINTSEQNGGAAVACNRLASALRQQGIDVISIVRDKSTEDPYVLSVNKNFFSHILFFIRFYWERLIIFINNGFCKPNLFKVSIANTGSDISNLEEIANVDIIHIHWINQGFLALKDIEKLKELGKPIVLTLHDMWYSTGICHHSFGCSKFESGCGHCFLINSSKKNDISRTIFKKKMSILSGNIKLISVSSWLDNVVKKSLITKKTKHSVIPNAIDTNLFYPQNKLSCRAQLGLPPEKKIILMGAANLNDENKGLAFLIEALNLLDNKNLLLVLFGKLKEPGLVSSLKIDFRLMGNISSIATIVTLYNASDITAVPSKYETFGQTLTESMACGVPTIAFDNSGTTDIINHKSNGYLAKYPDVKDFANGIRWILFESDYNKLCTNARIKISSNFTSEIIAKKHIDVYRQLL